MNIWLLMIIMHSISGVIAFITGLAILSPKRLKKHTWLLPTFLISLAGLIVFVVGAMISHWYDISPTEQVIFTGLVGLAIYILYRGVHARSLLHQQQVPENYIDDIGFILISLFNGFIIVALIDLGAPAWLVVVGAVLATVLGSRRIKSAKQNYLLPTAT